MNTLPLLKQANTGRRQLIAAVVLLCLSALSANAQTVVQDHITYSITNSSKTAMVTGTDGTYVKNVVIADSVPNSKGQYFPVESINTSAFENNRTITSVVFGSSLKRIRTKAFCGCSSLSRVVVPEGVETIENNAFQNCAVRYAELPSTLTTLSSGVFKTNSAHSLDTLVLHTVYTDASNELRGLPFNNSAFMAIGSTCTLMVPKKAYDWYTQRSINDAMSWGAFFSHIVAFGTTPSRCSVVPERLEGFRDLSKVDVTFLFDDDELADVLSLGPDDHIDASLVLPDGTSLEAGSVKVEGNTIRLDFAEVLQKHRELFIATAEDVTTMDVELKIGGQIQVEECPFALDAYFGSQKSITWSVPLLPSVYDLPAAPTVSLAGEAQDGLYDYKAFETVTLEFDGYTGLSLDSNTGAFINARLYNDGQLLCTSNHAEVEGDNKVTFDFAIPVDSLLVRRTSGTESYAFTLEVEGQVSMFEVAEDAASEDAVEALSEISEDDAQEVIEETDQEGSEEVDQEGSEEVDQEGSEETDQEGAEETDEEGSEETDQEGSEETEEVPEPKNFRFVLPFPEADADFTWSVRPIFFPEPTGVSFTPAADGVVTLDDLTDVIITLEGVSEVALDTLAAGTVFSAQLMMEGREIQSVDASRMRVEAGSLHLLFDPTDSSLITSIGLGGARRYSFSVNLAADLLTDGYPCRLLVGTPALPADSVALATAPYAQSWAAPRWSVEPIVWPEPIVTVRVPGYSGEGYLDYEQLRVVELNFENYDSVVPVPADILPESAHLIDAALVRGGRTVCTAGSVKAEGSRFTIDFGEALTYYAVGITPDDDPEEPVVLCLDFTGELLFDGIPYSLHIDGADVGAYWELHPVIIRKLPEPSVNYDGQQLSFSSTTEGVTFHYSIANADNLGTREADGVNTAEGGNRLELPLTREYIITVYSSRENYEDSEPKVVKLRLAGEPTISEQR